MRVDSKTENFWRRLSSQTRFMGTEGEASAVAAITEHLAADEFAPRTQEFEYEDWVPGDGVSLVAAGRRLDAYPMLGSTSVAGSQTDSEPIRGTLRDIGPFGVWSVYNWHRFSIVDVDNRPVAHVVGRTEHEAIPQCLPASSAQLPYVSIGSADTSWMRTELERGKALTAELHVTASTGSTRVGTNIYVDLPPRGPHSIVIGAHYDSLFNTRGAYDNASGAACLASLAEEFRDGVPGYAATIVWFGAEEWDLQGSRAFVRQLHDNGELPDLMVNLEGAGRGSLVEIWYGPDDLLPTLLCAVDDSAPPKRVNASYVFPPPPGSDHAPFYAEGCSVVMLTVNDQAILHRPEDVPDTRMLSNMGVLLAAARSIIASPSLVAHLVERKGRA